jgi:hypothetical protein
MKSPASTLRPLAAVAMIAASAILTGCGTMYVDTAIKEVPAADFRKPAQAAPVALNFEFQTGGAPNARATDFLKDAVAAQVKESGLFSEVRTAGAADAGLLQITLNNVPITKNAAEQGFVTGLTFGLAGSAVTDGYICQLSYLAPGKSTPVLVTARHAIHTTIGNASAPSNAVKAASGEEAVRTMARQVLSNALRDLAANPSF